MYETMHYSLPPMQTSVVAIYGTRVQAHYYRGCIEQ